MFEAIKSGDITILEETFRISGFIKDAIDEDGMSALHHAVLSHNIECISLLIDLQCPLHIQDNQGIAHGYLRRLQVAKLFNNMFKFADSNI